jgi:hypothetical protein
MKRVAVSITAAALLAIFLAPTSAADPTTRLKSEVDAARGEAGCPPFQSDPILNDVSQRAAHEMDVWTNHTGRFLPFMDTNIKEFTSVQQVLREYGYTPLKSRMLVGYGDYRTGGPGDNEAKAIKGAILQGWGFGVLSDCSYTKYGVAAINDDSSQGWPSTAPRSFTVTAVVVTGA